MKYVSGVTWWLSGGLIAGLVTLKLYTLFSPYPGIVPDELTYMRGAFFGNGQLGFVNPLFTGLYSTAQGCGEAWYQCVKSLNAVFDLLFAAALGSFVFASTKNLLVSTLIFGGVWLGPFSAYGSYFMPESMWAFLVGAFFVMLSLFWNRRFLAGAMSGTALGFAMLVKPHSFFIFLGLLFFGLALHFYLRRRRENADLSPLYIALAVSLMVRMVGGLAFGGLRGLNPLAGYLDSGALVSDLFARPAEDTSSPWVLERLPAALMSIGTNLAPGILIIIFIFLLQGLLTGQSPLKILRNRAVLLAFGVFVSLLFMAAAFGFYLEIRGAEATEFRAMTRYWQFSVALVIASMAPLALQERVARNSSSLKWLVVAFVFCLGLVVLIPQTQSFADTALFRGDIWILPATMVVFIGIAGIAFSSAAAVPVLASLLVVAFALAGSLGAIRNFESTGVNKAGAAAGLHLGQILAQNPADSERIVILGDRSVASTASFMAKLEADSFLAASFYSSTRYSDLEGRPRWVMTTKEVFLEGEPLESTLFGDVFIHEFGLPAQLRPVDFEKYGVSSEGSLLHTYWGAWIEGEGFSFTVPDSYLGDTLEVGLLVNDELSDTGVTVDVGDGPIFGELLSGQAITPVTFTTPDGSGWAGRVIFISYSGEPKTVLESDKGLSLGLTGFSVYKSK